MPLAIVDTSVYVNYWEGVLDEKALGQVRATFIVRQSSVVLSELRRGARTRQARRLVEALRRLSKIQWTPATTDWWQAGVIIQKIGDAHHWDRRKRQEFQNDTLIALSARRYGATIVTSNQTDFELLANELRIRILLV
ncbi:MAG: PIN domain-containing protein [Acidobacteria bacterium]|nr:PIN domain-containing protein [Acidobacteriota bacterium]